MVRIEKDKVVIELESRFPAESWVECMRDIVRCIAIADKERLDNDTDCIYGLCDLLEAMLPDETEARKLVKG